MSLPIVGYRLWIANSADHNITSLTDDTVWPVGGIVQADRSPDDERSWNQPGIHWYSRFDLGSRVYDMRPSYSLWFDMQRQYRKMRDEDHFHWVSGAIVAWGRTVLHEFGGRSHYAKLVALHYACGGRDEKRAEAYDEYDGTKPPPALRTIAARYGVPLCQSHAHLRAVACEHGREVYAEDLVA